MCKMDGTWEKEFNIYFFFLNVFCQKEWRVLCKTKKRNVSKKSKIHHNWQEKSGPLHLKKKWNIEKTGIDKIMVYSLLFYFLLL